MVGSPLPPAATVPTPADAPAPSLADAAVPETPVAVWVCCGTWVASRSVGEFLRCFGRGILVQYKDNERQNLTFHTVLSCKERTEV